MINARQRNVALLVACCFFMQNLDGTIVTTSAAKIGHSLGVSGIQVSLVITAYLITCAVLIPLGSWLIGGLGARRVFLGAIVVFTIASLLCAVSVNLPMLVAMRILQGVGGAMMTPTGRITALAGVEKVDMLRILSFVLWPSLIAPVVAPLAGGLITTYASWRWIFLINIPLGVIAFALGVRLMPDVPATGWVPFDSAGFAMTGIGLGGLTYTAHLLSVSTPWGLTLAWAVCSIGFLVAAVVHLRRSATPLLRLDVLSLRTFRSANAQMFGFTLVVGAVPFLLPLMFQNVFGWTAVKAGSLILCLFAGNVLMKPATTGLLRRFGFRHVIFVTSLCVAASVIVIGLVSRSTPIALIGVVLVCSGLARSMGYTSYMSLTFSDVDEQGMRDANVLYSTIVQVSAAFAVASGAITFHLGTVVAGAIAAHPAPTAGYTAAFFLLALVALVNGAFSLRLPRDAGDSLRGLVTAESVEPVGST